VQSESGLRRLIAFSDAVVAIAITLLILPLVDAASAMGTLSVSAFMSDNKTRLLAFLLSFAVIGRFWWEQHQDFELVISYNALLVWGMFLWLLSIVFLPFPTELLSSATHGSDATNHAIYIGTLLVAALASLVQRVALVHWPQLQEPESRGTLKVDGPAITSALMAIALVIAVSWPSQGLWALLLLLLSDPLERIAKSRRSKNPKNKSASTP
jgi:uncharacterized membrane protein